MVFGKCQRSAKRVAFSVPLVLALSLFTFSHADAAPLPGANVGGIGAQKGGGQGGKQPGGKGGQMRGGIAGGLMQGGGIIHEGTVIAAINIAARNGVQGKDLERLIETLFRDLMAQGGIGGGKGKGKGNGKDGGQGKGKGKDAGGQGKGKGKGGMGGGKGGAPMGGGGNNVQPIRPPVGGGNNAQPIRQPIGGGGIVGGKPLQRPIIKRNAK